MKGQHYQFTIDGTGYLLASECDTTLFPALSDRVVRYLERKGKESAKLLPFGFSATVVGSTELCKKMVPFSLTINPQGIAV